MRAREPRSRDARRELWLGITLMVSAQLAVLLCLESVWSLRDPEFARKLELLRARMAERPAARPLVLLLGSSRTGMGIRPSLLQPTPTPSGNIPLVFNFGMCRAGVMSELLYLKRLLDEGIRPDVVLVEVWYSHLCIDELEMIPPFRLRWRDIAGSVQYHRRPLRYQLAWAKEPASRKAWQRVVMSAGIVSDLLPGDPRHTIEWTGLDSWGWLQHPQFGTHRPLTDPTDRGPGGISPGLANAPMNYREQLSFFTREQSVCPAQDRALRDLIALCREKCIQVNLVLAPDAVREEEAPVPWTALSEYVRLVQRDTGVNVIDLRKWGRPEYFGDLVHLTHDGAAQFTQMLDREVLCPLLLGQLPAASLSRR